MLAIYTNMFVCMYYKKFRGWKERGNVKSGYTTALQFVSTILHFSTLHRHQQEEQQRESGKEYEKIVYVVYFMGKNIFPCDKQTAGKFDADLVFLDSEKLYNVLPSTPTTLSLFHVRISLFSFYLFFFSAHWLLTAAVE